MIQYSFHFNILRIYMLSKIAIVSLLGFLLLFGGCERKKEQQQNETRSSVSQKSAQSEAKEKEAPSTITLHTTNGEEILLTATPKGIIFKGYEGKIVILDFFATWCPPCRAEIPHLNDIQNAYKGKVQIIGILMEENKDDLEIQQFEENMGINYPVANSPANFALADALGGIRSLPTMVMYDKNGDYFTHYVGAVPQEMIEADIQRALTKK
ncbi:MAG: TlpA family protein disulfide reductase [Sulfurospirillum sp.]|nr:MAG: TlpA family protein disulfide reductase [Sulfurospirillum sp.]